MRIYYVAGIPYSNDLYHSGIKGQKWGVRRFQNADRTWTAAGKIRYGAQKTGEAIGKAVKKTGNAIGTAAKKTGKAIGTAIKKRHPYLMSDSELNEQIRRTGMEKQYLQNKRDIKSLIRGKNVVGGILERGANTLGDAAFNKLSYNMFGKDKKSASYQFVEKFKEEWEKDFDKGNIRSYNDIQLAADYVEALRRIEKTENNGGGKKKKGG